MLSKIIEDALNKQITVEAASSQVYLAMASWAETLGFEGVATFMYAHSDEEREHMLKLVKFINERGGHAKVSHLNAPPAEFGSFKEMFQNLFEHEVKVSKSINDLVDVTLQQKDYATHNFLQWYVSEQIEEEALARNILDKINLIEKSTENNFKLRFSVKDSGIGIAKSEQKIIFESFQQSNPSISSHYGGSGLGLAIARNLSKLLKTQIYLNSKLGEGSTFYFDLNVEVDQQEYEIKESSTKRLDKKESRVFEVLIIDDEITNILLAQSLIEVYFPKAKIKTAQNGEAALDQINQQKFDLLLMDLKMPQMNGFELTQIIRKMSNVNKDVPIVAITAGNREENYESCLLAGMNAYINKPIEEEDLIQTISDFLTNKNQHNTNNQIQHFNLNEISRKLKNDEEKVKKLVKAAQPMILSCVEKLNAAIKNNDAKAYYDCLHTVKGSSRNIGFEHLGNLAENAEKIDFLDKKEALNQIESIEKEVEHLKQLINDYIK